MLTKKEAIEIIEKEQREGDYNYPTEGFYIKLEDFYYRSYWHSGFEELKKYIKESELEDPIMIIEEYMRMITDFSCKANDKKLKGTLNLFNVYYDVVDFILDILEIPF